VKRFLKDDRVKNDWKLDDIKKMRKYAYFPAFASYLSDTYDDDCSQVGGSLKESKYVCVNSTPLSTPNEKKHDGFEYFFDLDSYDKTLQSFLEAQGKARKQYQTVNKIEVVKHSLFD
jgi:hypothetical protein